MSREKELEEARRGLHRAGIRGRDGSTPLEWSDERTERELEVLRTMFAKLARDLRPFVRDVEAAVRRIGAAFGRAVNEHEGLRDELERRNRGRRDR